MTGFELLEKVQAEPALNDVPVVVFTGKELSADEESRIKTMAKSIVLKDVQSPERLLDETALFLHRIVTDLPDQKQQMLERLHGSQEVLRGRKVLSSTTMRATSSPSPRSSKARRWRSSAPPTAARPSSSLRRRPSSAWSSWTS